MFNSANMRDPRVIAWEGGFICRTNAAYYQMRINLWSTIDLWLRFFAASAGAAGVMGMISRLDGYAAASIWVSGLSALANVFLLTHGTSDKLRNWSGLLTEYTRISSEFERLYRKATNEQVDISEAEAPLKLLASVEELECRNDSTFAKWQFRRAEKEVRKSLKAADPSSV